MRAFSLVRCSREFAPLRRRHPRHPRSHPWIRHAELSHLAQPRLLGRAPCHTRPSRTTATDSSRGGRGSGLAAQRHIAISARFLHCDIGRGALACSLAASLSRVALSLLSLLSLLSRCSRRCHQHVVHIGDLDGSHHRCAGVVPSAGGRGTLAVLLAALSPPAHGLRARSACTYASETHLTPHASLASLSRIEYDAAQGASRDGRGAGSLDASCAALAPSRCCRCSRPARSRQWCRRHSMPMAT